MSAGQKKSKKQSGANSKPQREPTLFLDRNLGKHIVANRLRSEGMAVEVHDDHLPRLPRPRLERPPDRPTPRPHVGPRDRRTRCARSEPVHPTIALNHPVRRTGAFPRRFAPYSPIQQSKYVANAAHRP